jgi:carboxylesterase
MTETFGGSGRSPGEPWPSSITPPDTNEFFFAGSAPSVLLIHGLTGTPYEVRYLGEQLAHTGIRAMGITLAGHRGPPEELAATSHTHWYESVVEGFERLRKFGDPIVVVGLSAGAVLAARLAEDQGEAVAALVMLAPAFFLAPRPRLALVAASMLGGWTDRIYISRGVSDIHDSAARSVHPGIQLMPLSAPLALLELSALVRPKIHCIKQPTLVIHSRRDHLCPYRRNVNFLTRHMGSSVRRTVILEESFHVITVDVEKDRVVDEIRDFVGPFRSAGKP